MRVRKVVVLLMFFALAVPASAETIEKIVFQIDDLAVNSDFGASTGQLVWSQGGIAILQYEGGDTKYRVTVSGLWDDMTDWTLPGGPASASFAAGDFDVTFFALTDKNKVTPIADLSGSLFSDAWSYYEAETAQNPSELYGSALIKLDTWNVPGYQWAELLGSPGGLTATTSNLVQWDILNYQSDWSSDSAIVTIMANESGIPEPATICLLGLGAVAMLRRRQNLP